MPCARAVLIFFCVRHSCRVDVRQRYRGFGLRRRHGSFGQLAHVKVGARRRGVVLLRGQTCCKTVTVERERVGGGGGGVGGIAYKRLAVYPVLFYQRMSPSERLGARRVFRRLSPTIFRANSWSSVVKCPPHRGLGRASPHSVFPHHLAAISSAIVRADALCIRNNAASLASQLSHGII